MNRIPQLIKLLVLGALSIFLLSCETVGYYTQAARGQLSIMTGREDIERLLADDTVSAQLKEKLELVLELRQFAETEMQLPVANNYSTFVDVGREHVVWNVFAAPEFSTEAINWCYPIAGCVSYRGYFSENAASNYAQRLSAEGYDVYTGGVDAYSTLGWFDDSLLSTVINRQDYQLAGLIFHELAHQVLYVQGDTTFNESYATAVEREGVRRWLKSKNQEESVTTADAVLSRQQEFVDLVIAWREKFAELYDRDMDTEDMRDQKQDLQQQMRVDYERIKRGWGGYAGYDSWFARSLNNAQLSTVASYNSLVPHFNALMAAVDGDMSAFYQRVKEIAALPPEQREQSLSELCLDC